MAYIDNPELIARVRTIKSENEKLRASCIAGLKCFADDKAFAGGLLQIDIQGTIGFDNVVIEFDAEQFMQAVARAMMHRDE